MDERAIRNAQSGEEGGAAALPERDRCDECHVRAGRNRQQRKEGKTRHELGVEDHGWTVSRRVSGSDGRATAVFEMAVGLRGTSRFPMFSNVGRVRRPASSRLILGRFDPLAVHVAVQKRTPAAACD